MNRYPYRKGRKKRPTLKAIVTHRLPNPGRSTAGGLGWEYVYPVPPICRHEYPEPCDWPTPYAAVRAKAGPNGKAP